MRGERFAREEMPVGDADGGSRTSWKPGMGSMWAPGGRGGGWCWDYAGQFDLGLVS
jgi:hypothetical protein